MTEPPDTSTLALLRQIVLDVSAAHTVEDQVERVVRRVRDAMGVDVCSLYLANAESTLRLIANVGLARGVVGTIELPVGEGLVGTVAETQLPLNLETASEHPKYRYFPDSGEEVFEAFLGVPLVHFGNVTGVLVVQDRRRRPFTANEETLLITVASQLAGSLLRWPEPERRRGTRTLATRRIQGIKGAPGVGIGRLHLIGGDALVQAVESPAPVDTPTESARLNDAVMMLNTELAAARQRLEGAVTHDVLAILDFYKLMLESDELIAAAQRRIHTGMSAFAAVRITVDECVLAFESMSDEYLRARGEDVRHIGTRLMSAMLGRSAQLPDDATDVVLVGDAIAVTDIARFGPGQLAGIVSLRGSTLSHTAVLANALGIPAVMAVGALDHLVEGERAIVDGSLGLLFLNPTGSLVREYRRILDQAQALNRELLANKDLPASTTDGFRVRLLANTGLLADAAPGLANGAEGIGLYRSEIPFLAHATFPTEDEQYEIYREILALYHPHPVTMRTLDVGGDKTLPYMTFDEENPSLGWRGIRFTLDNRAVFHTQLRAMLRANTSFENLRIMLPMVSAVADVAQAAELMRLVLDELEREGMRATSPPLGIMIEVPGVIALLPALRRHIRFVSVGTNDLTQYLLAVDRNNPRVAARYDFLHPAVLHALTEAVTSANALGLELSVCGEMAGDPVAATLLVGMGIETLSMSAYHVPRIKELIRRVDLAGARELLARAMALDDASSIRVLVREALVARALDHLLEREAPP